ncbi:hypothetical protein C8R47DRAFT_189305 [Mycena vitilis]|nr:hypothetical protein C8R47DRAFT_189305 [Mycena vitilis]
MKTIGRDAWHATRRELFGTRGLRGSLSPLETIATTATEAPPPARVFQARAHGACAAPCLVAFPASRALAIRVLHVSGRTILVSLADAVYNPPSLPQHKSRSGAAAIWADRGEAVRDATHLHAPERARARWGEAERPLSRTHLPPATWARALHADTADTTRTPDARTSIRPRTAAASCQSAVSAAGCTHFSSLCLSRSPAPPRYRSSTLRHRHPPRGSGYNPSHFLSHTSDFGQRAGVVVARRTQTAVGSECRRCCPSTRGLARHSSGLTRPLHRGTTRSSLTRPC